MDKFFFSIIIPAHNEEGYIENTLAHLKQLDYPADRYEVIIVENGSADRTFELAKKFAGGNFKVLQSGKGTSRAKNVGIDNLSPHSDWVIFLDADTILEKDFLNELNAFLHKPNAYSVGTVSLRPLPETAYANAWFWLYNIGHIITRTSQSIKIVKRSLFPTIRFNEQLVMGEDLDVIVQAKRHGSFFFLRTKNALTSTRRFEKLGWWYVFFSWIFVALLPKSWQRRFTYEIVR